MPELTEFQRKKLDKIAKATEVEVRDVLKMVLDDLESGSCTADGILVITVLRESDNSDKWQVSSYRAGIARCHEIALLESRKFAVLQGWIE